MALYFMDIFLFHFLELSEESNALSQIIDRSVLEASSNGYDNRPFNSQLYMNAPHEMEFLAALNMADKEEMASTTTTSDRALVEENKT